MTEPADIRPMTALAYDDVFALWSETPGIGLRSYDDSREGIERFLKRNPATCFAAWAGETLTGVILCGHDGRRAYLYHVAVRQTHQRHGIGRALVNAVLNALRAEGIAKCALVAYADNDQGNAFWSRMGFTVRDDLHYRDIWCLPEQ